MNVGIILDLKKILHKSVTIQFGDINRIIRPNQLQQSELIMQILLPQLHFR
jgi:hypothetical protein